MRGFFADLGLFVAAVVRHWIAGVTGGILAVALSFTGVFHPLPKNIVAAALIGYVIVAAFYAWRTECQKTLGKKRDSLLDDILTRTRRITTTFPGVSIPGAGMSTVIVDDVEVIGAMIQCYADFGDETDVVWICKEIETLGNRGADPFWTFEVMYGEKAWIGKRLKFLRDAHMHGGISNEQDAKLYLQAFWADANGLKEVPSLTPMKQ